MGLNDWHGNVMVPNNSYDHEIDKLEIWCIECTKNSRRERYSLLTKDLASLNWSNEQQKRIHNSSGYLNRFGSRIRDEMLMIINKK